MSVPPNPSGFVCAFIGDDSLLIRCAEVARHSGHDVRCVITAAPAIGHWARGQGVAVLDAEGDFARALADLLAGTRLDLLFSVANLRRVPPDILQLATKGGVNFHDGPLPRYGGVHAPAWALLAGEREYAITWHRMTERMDAGEVILQRAVAIDEDDTSLTLNLKCFQAGAESFGDLLDALTHAHPRAQPHELDRATYHRKSDRVPGAATLDWTRRARELVATVRALDFGNYRNTLGVAKVAMPKELLIVRAARSMSETSNGPPGTVVRADANGIVVSTAGGDVLLESFATLEGIPVAASDAAGRGGVRVGESLQTLDAGQRATLTAMERASAPYEAFWVQRLSQDPLDIPVLVSPPGFARPDAGQSWRWLDAFPFPDAQLAARQPQLTALAGVCAWLGHVTARASYDMSLAIVSLERNTMGIERWVMDAIPLRVELESITFSDFTERLSQTVRQLTAAGIPLRDLIARSPELRDHHGPSPVAVILANSIDDVAPPSQCALAFALDARGAIRIGFDPRVVDERALRTFDGQFPALLASARAGVPVDRLSLLDDAARRSLTQAMAGETVALDPSATISSIFAAQVTRTPDAVAVVGADRQLTYRELDRESERLAKRLRGLGIAKDVPVGIYLHRSTDLLVTVLGILKAGGAYLPLDPGYPSDRIRHMIVDSETPVIVTSSSLAASVPAASTTEVLRIEEALAARAGEDAVVEPADVTAVASALAYVIYTSGSTGVPKGVMVEHRNVTSFFAAMDRLLGTTPVSWLAVTSLSFDISVLELLWPLTHGSTVVIHAERGERGRVAAPRVAFSLFYFSADEGATGAEKYKLLLEGARFADRHGFAAVWTPERHFHDFGGIFPNPSVTSAAVAAITERVAIRAGSVVLPLHHPLRIAEEWSVVDNLSNGRVGISFASGWRPEDFVLRPEGYKDAKKRMLEGIETVRRLWRGESLPFEGPDGKPVDVAIHPRPVQAELPVFITAAGSPDTFEAAGKSGAGVLTHLLGQTLDELKEKIDLYRAARRTAGHAGPGQVALMLHTFVGDDDAEVKNTVRGPMKAYLRTSVSLIEKNAQAFPTFKKRADGSMPKLDFASLSEQDADALLEYSFERYFETSGLFGTVDRCVTMTEKLASIGVDEVACLIDFGVDPDLALRHLEHLDKVRGRFEAPVTGGATIPQSLRDHRVTHLQCTPSQALLLLADESARAYLPRLTALLVGGEAMPPTLARSLGELGVRRLVNMYGPTETTVWSTSHEVSAANGAVPIGRPIANTLVRIVGLGGSVVPQGVPGELLIGGPGVTRGYLKRADLTSERFVETGDPAAGRMYRTGDQVRLSEEGELDFLGRGDTQVKVRGYRIELGEIERALGRHSAVGEAVVVAWGDQPDGRRLVGYVSLRSELANAATVLRESLRASLPEFMIPSQVVVLAEFPRTPNGKTDRKRLPRPDAARSAASGLVAASQRAAPAASGAGKSREATESLRSSELLQAITGIWCDVLHVETVGLDDNFFDVGGHSLLAVQVHQRVKNAVGRDFPITDLFRYSTIRSLASHLGGDDKERDSAASRGTDRAALRRQASQRRR